MYFALIGYVILLLYTFLVSLIATGLYRDRRILSKSWSNLAIAAVVYLIGRFILSQSAQLRNALPVDTITLFFIAYTLIDTLVRAIPPVNLWQITDDLREREAVIAWLENSRKSYWPAIPVFVMAIFLALVINSVFSGGEGNLDLYVLAPIIFPITFLLVSYLLTKVSIGLGKWLYPPPDIVRKTLWRNIIQASPRQDRGYSIWSRGTSLGLGVLFGAIVTIMGTPYLLDQTKELIQAVAENRVLPFMGRISLLAFVLASTYTAAASQRWNERR
jgi:hypothetical protein